MHDSLLTDSLTDAEAIQMEKEESKEDRHRIGIFWWPVAGIVVPAIVAAIFFR